MKRQRLALIVLAVAVFAVAAVVWVVPILRPNELTVLFVLDTVRRDALGCYGNPLQPTPAIDAIARDGVRFEHAISSSGWTLPAVASLLTGAWPTIHGAIGRGTTLRPIRKEVPTCAEVLEAHGFKTYGYANAAFVSPMVGIDRGFDVFDHRYTYNWDTRRADETIDAALEQLRRDKGGKRFYMIHLFDAHLDYDPPGEYATKYTGGRRVPEPPLTYAMCEELAGGVTGSSAADIDYIRNVYYGEVAFMDAHIGRFIATLRELDLYDDATIVVIADHGEEFWDHGGFEHGHTLYDELVRVPLVLKLPARVSVAAAVVDAQVRSLDVMPTVFELAGIDPPPSFVGESLLPLISGDASAARPAFCESTLYGAHLIAWRDEDYTLIHNLDPESQDPGALYDRRRDPEEQTDLAKELPEETRRLRNTLLSHYDELSLRASRMSQPDMVDLRPERIEQLRSLGYIR